MEQAIKMLVRCLSEKEMSEEDISSCISFLWDFIADQNVYSCQELNLKMQAGGWKDFELDEQQFNMITSALKN